MQNITESFADYLIRKSENITAHVREKARLCMEDYMAVAAAGARNNISKWGEMLSFLPHGNAELYGYGIRTDSKTAALINGFNAHTLELDDGHRFAMIHLGACVVSAVMSAVSDFPETANRAVDGIIMGYEAACRTAMAMQPSHKKRGYHASGTCGTIGAAVSVSFVLGFNASQLKTALTVAAGSAAGMLEIQSQSSEIKPYNVGRAAMDGLSAAYMGLSSFAVPLDMLGGERGFFNTFSDSWNADRLLENTGYFEIERIYVKPYASCRHSHSAVEAAIRLNYRIRTQYGSAKKGIDEDIVKKVTVRTYRLGVKGHDHKTVYGMSDAKLSTPYSVAVALLYGRCGLSEFDPVDKSAARLSERTEVLEDEALTALCPQKRAAVVIVELEDGKTMSEQTEYAKGEPENPLTGEEMSEKLVLLNNYRIDKIKEGEKK